MYGQESDLGGGAGKKRERKAKADVVRDRVQWRRLTRNIDLHKSGKGCGR